MNVLAVLLISLVLAVGGTAPIDALSTGDSLGVRDGVFPTAKAKKWKWSEDAVTIGLDGVSPHVMKTASGDRLWRSSGSVGTAVTMCDDTGVCTEESFSSSIGPVMDYATALTTSGWRAYFKVVNINVTPNTQGVYSAPCTTDACLSFGQHTLTSSGMLVTKAPAWGVPDPVTLPDGRVRIYLVETLTEGPCPERIASFISSDGITFTREKGWRLTGGFVDSEVLRAKVNDWVMIVADGPGCGSTKRGEAGKPQQLYISTSKNGLKWTKPKVLTKTDEGRLDPVGYEISPNVFRIYYASGSIKSNEYTIKRATLSLE